MTDTSIHAYIDLCRQGDKKAFGYIVSAYQQQIYVLAFRLLCDKAEAEDITQETFIRTWLYIDRYDRQYQFSTWIYRIACNLCYDRLRTGQGRIQIDLADLELPSEITPADKMEHEELRTLIAKATEGLSPKQRLVFTLSEIEGLDVEEIVTITGMSPAKIKSNLYLARKYVKSKIKEDE